MVIGEKGRFREVEPEPGEVRKSCTAIRIMNLTGPLFFAAAGELQSVLDQIIYKPEVRVLILRMRQASDLDVTTASVLESTGSKLGQEGKTLLLLGIRHSAMRLLEQTGIAERLGYENLFPVRSGWLTAMESALQRALELSGEHSCGKMCPLAEYLAAQDSLRSIAERSPAS